MPEGESVDDVTLSKALELLATKAQTAKSSRKTSQSKSSNPKSTTKSKATTAKKK
ncbi:topoisomerase C-terminal repeat-containing protein [Aetokthonos hydrillicola]|uniref:topoisomerase C-terminal repeat-containing protein n=1 Tax=Aetokthonos hydrillicola TaxID=1550245 RepID=UPI0030D7ED95